MVKQISLLEHAQKFSINMHLAKKKSIRSNQRPFMNKHISKEIMKRSKLRNKFLKTRNNNDKFNYITGTFVYPLYEKKN